MISEKELKEKMSKNDAMELEKLDKRGDFLNGLADISDIGWTISGLSLIGAIVYSLYFESIPIVNKIIIGLMLYFIPWMAWLIKFMNISVNFTVTNSILICSGLTIGTWVIKDIVGDIIENTQLEADVILEKYLEEENNGD